MTFDQAADLYEHARPDYPDELFDRLLEVTGLGRGARLLEIGCATGKATVPLAARGMRITCIELGPALAAVARGRLEPFSDVEVIEGAFEDWEGPAGGYDLVFAATAWQWVDPAARYQRAARALRSRGFLAFWDATHVFPVGGDPFFADIKDVYDEIGEQLPAGACWPAPGELADHRAEIEASGLFEVVDVHHLDWEIAYDARSYIDLLDTFSGHIAMEGWQRDRLYSEIRQRLDARPDQMLRRGWGAVLHIAQRTP
jgi:SAM-dependent methyltransferase